MNARANAVVWLVLGAWCALPGCYTTDVCTPERCDNVDNDCDKKIDEDYRDELGRYTGIDNCGHCGLSCETVYPTAVDVECSIRQEVPRCEITACSDSASRMRTTSCSSGGNIARIRITVLCASGVWSVDTSK